MGVADESAIVVTPPSLDIPDAVRDSLPQDRIRAAYAEGVAMVQRRRTRAKGLKRLERAWRRALHDGVIAGTGREPVAPSLEPGRLAKYPGLKEEVYLGDFTPDATVLKDLDIEASLETEKWMSDAGENESLVKDEELDRRRHCGVGARRDGLWQLRRRLG